jgi:hypothetical protein
MSEALEPWKDFNVAMVGATAALAGLLIVAMSVNISTIMTSATLPARAGASVATLVLAIVACAFGLVPGQPVALYGVEVLIGGGVAAVFQLHSMRVLATKDRVSTPWGRFAKAAVGVLPLLGFLVGGVLVIAGVAPAGLAFVALGSVLAVITSILLAWVVLVEVLR